MRLKYVAYTEAGKKIVGQSDGDKKTVLKGLRSKGLSVVELDEVKLAAKAGNVDLSLVEQESIFSRLAYLTENGVKIDRALQTLLRTNPDSKSREFVEDVSLRVSAGETLYAALSHYDDYIDHVYLAGIKLGEEIGALAPTFDQIARSIQSRLRLKKNVQKALTYPLAVFAFSVLSLFFIFNFIVPRISTIFKGVKELPWYTDMLLSTSDFVVDNQAYIVGLVVLVVVLAINIFRNPVVKARAYLFLFHVPYVRRFVVAADQIRFCSAMSLGVGSGLLVHQAVEVSAEALKNEQSREAALQAASRIREGADPAEALIDAHVIPGFHTALIEVTQDGASLGRAFSDVTVRLQDEMDDSVSRMMTLLEPALIGVMGVIIGGIVLVMMLSVMSIQDVGI